MVWVITQTASAFTTVLTMSNKINMNRNYWKKHWNEKSTYSFCFVEVIHTYVAMTVAVEIQHVEGGACPQI